MPVFDSWKGMAYNLKAQLLRHCVATNGLHSRIVRFNYAAIPEDGVNDRRAGDRDCDITPSKSDNYHQMDIEGEALRPSRADLIKLAASNSLDTAWASDIIVRFTTVGSKFKTFANDYAIRPATREFC